MQKNCEQKRFYSTWGRSIRSQAETRPLNVPLPKQCESWPIPRVCPPVFQTTAFRHCQTSLLLLLFSKPVSQFSNHPFTVSRSLNHPSSTPAAAVLLWDPLSSQLPAKSLMGGQSSPQVTTPAEMITAPFQTTFPFPAQISGNSSQPTFGHLAWNEADEACKTLSLTFRAANF